MFNIINKIKFLLFCYHRGHQFGTAKYEPNSEIQICARCGYKKRKKYKYMPNDDYYIY